jgi:hypothetical protein
MGKKGGGRNAFVKSAALNKEDAVGPPEVSASGAEAPEAGAAALTSAAHIAVLSGDLKFPLKIP